MGLLDGPDLIAAAIATLERNVNVEGFRRPVGTPCWQSARARSVRWEQTSESVEKDDCQEEHIAGDCCKKISCRKGNRILVGSRVAKLQGDFTHPIDRTWPLENV